MPQFIATNIPSLNAQRHLNNSQSLLATSIERLSSGLRINSAKDGAAEMAIITRMTAQIEGLNQAARNANDGISFSQTAEGGLQVDVDALLRIRELAVQSINDTNSSSDRQALNDEVGQLIAEINRVANSTQFNGQNILDGSLSTLTFQVGANQNQTIQVDGVDARGSQLGAASGEGDSILASDITALTDVSLNGITVDLTSATTVNEVINAINNQAAETNVEAIRATTTTTPALAHTAADDTISINGVSISTFALDSTDQLIDRINNFNTQTGVTATNSGGDIILSNNDGSDVEVVDAGGVIGGDETFHAGIVLATDVGETITVGGADDANLGLSGIIITDNILNDVNVLTGSSANDALLTIDFALQQINGLRAELGAVQTRFELTIANLTTTSENLSAARSRIRDTDFAAETANLARAQILQQAGIAMVAQANVLPQNALALLG